MSPLRKALLVTLQAYVRDEIRRGLRGAGLSREQVECYLTEWDERHVVDGDGEPGSPRRRSMPGA